MNHVEVVSSGALALDNALAGAIRRIHESRSQHVIVHTRDKAPRYDETLSVDMVFKIEGERVSVWDRYSLRLGPIMINQENPNHVLCGEVNWENVLVDRLESMI